MIRNGATTRRSTLPGGWASLLMMLSVLFLMAAPGAPTVAAPLSCCLDAPCPDQMKSVCPTACIIACHLIASPEQHLAEPIRHGVMLDDPAVAMLPTGRGVPPDLPPPR